MATVTSGAAIEMPRYKSHKTVHALKIAEVRQSPADVDIPGGSWEIVPENNNYAPIVVPHDFITKHNPQAGGYYVVYSDGYASFSPAVPFEQGYTLESSFQPARQREIALAMDADCFTRARARGEQTFTLVARDRSSPRVICEWIKENIETAPAEKLLDALKDALAMREHPNRKAAD